MVKKGEGTMVGSWGGTTKKSAKKKAVRKGPKSPFGKSWMSGSS